MIITLSFCVCAFMLSRRVLGVHRAGACDPVDSTHKLSQTDTEAENMQAEHHWSNYALNVDDIGARRVHATWHGAQ